MNNNKSVSVLVHYQFRILSRGLEIRKYFDVLKLKVFMRNTYEIMNGGKIEL